MGYPGLFSSLPAIEPHPSKEAKAYSQDPRVMDSENVLEAPWNENTAIVFQATCGWSKTCSGKASVEAKTIVCFEAKKETIKLNTQWCGHGLNDWSHCRKTEDLDIFFRLRLEKKKQHLRETRLTVSQLKP